MTWVLTLDTLLGKPLPPLPEIPGRVHTLATADDRMTEQDRDDILASDLADREVATLLGVTRQRAWQLRQATTTKKEAT